LRTYRVEMAFYVEAESEAGALLFVEDNISSSLARDYDWVDTEVRGG